MINCTDNILIKELEKLKKELIPSIKKTKKIIKKYYKNNLFNVVFCKKLSEDNIKILEIDIDFIKKIFNYSINKDFNCEEIKKILNSNLLLLEKPYLKSALKLMFLDLWKKDLLILPLSFNIGHSFNDEIISYYDNSVIKELQQSLKNKDEINKTTRLLRATDYKKMSDVSLSEINDLHITLMKQRRGDIELNLPKTRFQIENLLSFFKEKINDFNYEAFEYKQWYMGYFRRYKEFNYIEYQNSKGELENYRKEYNNKQTKERKIENNINDGIIKADITIEDEFFNQYKNNWTKEFQSFDGYSFENLEEDSKLWIEVFNSYQFQRKKNGYESTISSKLAFNFIMNYMFFYLNLWNQKNKYLEIPKSPKDFHRTLFINSPLNKEKDLPFNIIELLDYKNRSNSYKNTILRNIEMFFNFISDVYSDEPTVWTNGLKNPIKKSDYYREYGSKKTNKIIIPKSIYGKLKKYLYSLEAFGEYLEENNIYLEERFRDQNLINSSEYGFIPLFFDKGKVYPIFDVPNTLLFKRRTYEDAVTGHIVTESIVSNTVIRAFILMLNTGLRAAQVEWLDRRTWNKYEPDNIEKTYYKLNVNTDKTKNSEWMSYVSNSVYKSLQKETAFQNSMREDFIDLEVNYQGREYSRFENIIPLFKSDSQQGKPIDFRNSWVEILWQFQNILNRIETEKYELITITKPQNQKIEYFGDDRLKYSPLNIKAVHTPHSMRATFCTHMAEYLERSEIAALVGHSSELITSDVYIKPEDQTLIDKIDKANNFLDNGVNSGYFSKSNEAHIKPQLKNSSLQKAFMADREQAIELFNISSISLDINKDSEEQRKRAIGLLKDARMDQVIFDTTHICPVGGICPVEVMGAIKEKRRCGLCPLALKTIDNINPIYAKQRDLIRLIKEGKEELDIAIKNNDSEIKIVSFEDRINLDIRELVSWRFSAEVLSKHYEQIKDDKTLEKKFFVEMPDMVKNHLEKVSVSTEKEYLLTRIADSNAYSAYGNNSNKYQADTLKRHIVKSLSLFDLEDYNVDENEKIEFFCSMIKNMLDSNGIGLKKLVEYDVIKSIENKKDKAQSFLMNKKIKLLK